MRLFVEFFVADLNTSRDFFTRVMNFTVERDHGSFLTLVRDDVQLHLLQTKDLPEPLRAHAATCPVGSRVEFCLEVADLASLKAEQQRIQGCGWPIHAGIRWQSWNKYDFRLVDPNGAYIRITTPTIRN
jgi:lactoylglutathione lyase